MSSFLFLAVLLGSVSKTGASYVNLGVAERLAGIDVQLAHADVFVSRPIVLGAPACHAGL